MESSFEYAFEFVSSGLCSFCLCDPHQISCGKSSLTTFSMPVSDFSEGQQRWLQAMHTGPKEEYALSCFRDLGFPVGTVGEVESLPSTSRI